MGLDLTLLPFDCDRPGLNFSHTLLDCERRRDLFDAISDAETRSGGPVPEGFASYKSDDDKYEESHYGETKADGYGDPLRWMAAGELWRFVIHEGATDNHKNRAIWAYLAALPPETRVALYWG